MHLEMSSKIYRVRGKFACKILVLNSAVLSIEFLLNIYVSNIRFFIYYYYFQRSVGFKVINR